MQQKCYQAAGAGRTKRLLEAMSGVEKSELMLEAASMAMRCGE
jgi:hypothetical protein